MEQLTPLQELECIYSDMHKDVYGVKARWISFSSVEEAEEALTALQAAGEAERKYEVEQEAKAIEEFEKRLGEMIETGAGDRKTAIRWLDQAHGTQGDMEFLAYQLGLPYKFFNRE